MDVIHFLGRFHVLVLHLPIGIIVVTVLAEILGRTRRYATLRGSLDFLWALTALTAIATVLLGFMHFSEGGFDGDAGNKHRLFGTSVALVATAVWLLRPWVTRAYRGAGVAAALVMLILVTLTGHYGGQLTHGDTYLLEYAPAPLRSLAGLPERRRKVVEPAQADTFADIVLPIFNARCATCHNAGKARGGLSLASYTSLMKGGEKGAVISPGVPENSELVRRISLPPDHKDAMPAEGKTPLTDDQKQAIRWWVSKGAKPTGTLGEASPSMDELALFGRVLGLTSQGAVPLSAASAASVVMADPHLVASLADAGFQVRQLSQTNAGLGVSAVGIPRISDAQLKTLIAAEELIQALSLRRSGLTDAQLAKLASLKHLSRLDIAQNDVSDSGLKAFLPGQKISYLNLFGNQRITDTSLAQLKAAATLKSVYLWETRVTPAALEELKKARPDLVVIAGDAPS